MQAYLTPQQLPVSFMGQALIFGAHTKVLNPIKEGTDYSTKLLKNPLRFLARLVYQVATAILIAPFGALYHLGMAAYHHKDNTATNNANRRYLHLDAAKQDFFAFFSLGGLLSFNRSFCSRPKIAENFFLPTVHIQEENTTHPETFIFYINSRLSQRV